jgi:hypothetical protein
VPTPPEKRDATLLAATPFAWAACLGASYLADLGRGFIKDDFAWIEAGRFSGPGGLLELFGRDLGFYRPMVALSFGLDERLFGLDPYAFGATNLLLVLLCAVALGTAARSLGLSTPAALSAAMLWSFNPHGIGGAVMWISGRTSLLALLFALLATWAWSRGRWLLAVPAYALALLSKEEAALLPLVLAVWGAVLGEGERPERARRFALTLLAFSPALVLYAALRSRTAAFLPWSAPEYYAPTTSAGALLRNVLEYLDRTSTFVVAGLLVATAVAWARPRLARRERQWLVLGAAWVAGGLATTVALPVRSSLYAVYPSAGAALAAGAVLGALWRDAPAVARRRLAVAAVLVPLVMLPVQRSRNVRMVRHGELSARVVSLVQEHRRALRRGSTLALADDPAQRVNLANTFGTLMDVAARVVARVPPGRVRIEPDPATGGYLPYGAPALRYRLEGAELRPVPTS